MGGVVVGSLAVGVQGFQRLLVGDAVACTLVGVALHGPVALSENVASAEAPFDGLAEALIPPVIHRQGREHVAGVVVVVDIGQTVVGVFADRRTGERVREYVGRPQPGGVASRQYVGYRRAAAVAGEPYDAAHARVNGGVKSRVQIVTDLPGRGVKALMSPGVVFTQIEAAEPLAVIRRAPHYHTPQAGVDIGQVLVADRIGHLVAVIERTRAVVQVFDVRVAHGIEHGRSLASIARRRQHRRGLEQIVRHVGGVRQQHAVAIGKARVAQARERTRDLHVGIIQLLRRCAGRETQHQTQQRRKAQKDGKSLFHGARSFRREEMI